jgi:hypothetical protein
MRWFAVLALLCVWCGSACASGADDQYLDIYNQILQADGLQQSGHSAAASARYLDAQRALKKLKEEYPAWNTEVVSFRLDYLAEQIQVLAKVLPPTNAPPPQAAAPAPQPATAMASLQEQVRSLTAANTQLENKLKEALSVQPAALSPAEAAKAEQKVLALQKEKDLLSVALEQAKAARTPAAPSAKADDTARQLADASQALAELKAHSAEQAKAVQMELAQLKDSLADAKKKIAADAAEMESLKLARATKAPRDIASEGDKLKEERAELKAHSAEQAKAAQMELAQLKDSLADAKKQIAADGIEIETLKSARAPEDSRDMAAERDKLKEELAARTRDLADAEAHRDPSVAALRAQLAETERQRDEWKAKQASAPVAAAAPSDAQADQLRARLAVLEAQAVPYMPEELAVMKQNPSPASTQAPLPAPAQAAAPAPAAMPAPPAAMPAPPAASKHIAHSMKDLPPGAGALMTEARRAAMERDYAKAAGKYEEILRQDPDNVYVLGHLAKTQYDMGQLGECEKTAIRSVALDPDDPAGLYILGVLRYRQERLDEALDALSRSARFNPTNAGTQYYLGNVLAEKGLRQASETAFRKALQCEPDYAEAHYGLACVYAEEKPPSLELARWHYRRSLDLGHDKNQALEKALAPISPQ